MTTPSTGTPTGPLLAERFVLTADQLAAALRLAGIEPGPRSALPAIDAPADAAAALSGAAVLDAGGALRLEARAALGVAADPSRMLTVVTNRAGRPAWTETTFLHGPDGDGPVVALSTPPGAADLALLPTPAQALVTLDELLAISGLPGRPGAEPVRLDLAAYAALLGTSDLLHEARLEARLARERRPLPAITADAVERQLTRGLASNDTRWAVTAARAVCPADLGAAMGRIDGGLESLVEAGLLARTDSRLTVSDAGLALFTDLDQIVNSAGLLLAAAHEQEPVGVAHLGLFRCATAVWFVAWRGVTATGAEVDLYQSSPVGALNALAGLLSPVELPTAQA